MLEKQLKEICKSTKARWAVWIRHSEDDWDFGASYGLSKARQAALKNFIHQPLSLAWLSGAFSSGRMRTRQTSAEAQNLGCQRIYFFPETSAHVGLLVGASILEKSAESFFKILLMNPPAAAQLVPGQDHLQGAFPYIRSLGASLEVSYDPEGILANILEYLAKSVPCDAALLSVRSGDIFQVEAVWNCPDESLRSVLSLRNNHILSDMAANHKGLLINDIDSQVNDRILLGFDKELSSRAKAWLGVPIVIGRRIIGHLAFLTFSERGFISSDLQDLSTKAARLAYVVENAIVFTEAARYLQQLAMLNELASVASSSVDPHEVANRVMQRLYRTFRTENAGVYLLSPDGNTFREYGAPALYTNPLNAPVEPKIMERVMAEGIPLRVGDLSLGPGFEKSQPGKMIQRSGLVVPLKYRGKVIGALALGSDEANAFSQQDEQLLVVISSHLAGLFENIRLNEETRQRAYNLNLIHQVVQKVIGLNDPLEIARVAAELMVKGFSHEAVAVILLEERVRLVILQDNDGIKSLPFYLLKDSDLAKLGITQVLEDGQSLLTTDSTGKFFEAGLPPFEAGSEMCVPLKEGEHILGAIIVARKRENAFTENDLLALEALAGVLSSVVLSARRYRQLQDSVRQLQAVRESALDIAGNLDLDALLNRIVHRARELVGARGANLGLLDEKEQVLRILVSDTPWTDTTGEQIPLLAGVEGRVAAFGEPLVVNDYNNWNGRLFPEREAPYSSLAGVPLMFQGKVIGTLTVIDDRPGWIFTTEHVRLLELLAPQAAVWIRNARLYQELEERIQAQHMAENRLIRSARLAAVGEMAAGVAHELNNPLTTVTGFVELLLDEMELDPPHQQELELVLRESQRARGVVRRLLDFSRPAENRRIRSNLNELVNDVVILVHHLARTGGVEIRTELNDGLPWVFVDPSQIKQVLLNLVHNAIHAMPAGGRLGIKTFFKRIDDSDEQKDWVVVSVSDNGTGISPKNLERIFEPFFTTRPTGKGTGLGLSVSYGIISDHGGFIEVESEVDQGSCFSVYFSLETRESYA